jgi:hypothetical protein
MPDLRRTGDHGWFIPGLILADRVFILCDNVKAVAIHVRLIEVQVVACARRCDFQIEGQAIEEDSLASGAVRSVSEERPKVRGLIQCSAPKT